MGLKCKQIIQIATFNVRTLNRIGQLPELTASAVEYKIDIICIQEHWYRCNKDIKYHDTGLAKGNVVIFSEKTYCNYFQHGNVVTCVCLLFPRLVLLENKGGWRSKKMPLGFIWRLLMAAWNKGFTFMPQVS